MQGIIRTQVIHVHCARQVIIVQVAHIVHHRQLLDVIHVQTVSLQTRRIIAQEYRQVRVRYDAMRTIMEMVRHVPRVMLRLQRHSLVHIRPVLPAEC